MALAGLQQEMDPPIVARVECRNKPASAGNTASGFPGRNNALCRCFLNFVVIGLDRRQDKIVPDVGVVGGWYTGEYCSVPG